MCFFNENHDLQNGILEQGPLPKGVHMSGWWTSFETRLAAFESCDTDLSDDAGLVLRGVDYAELRAHFEARSF